MYKMERKDFIVVRRDSENKVEIVKREKFDESGYSFLKYNGNSTMEEWVETDKLDNYKKLEE